MASRDLAAIAILVVGIIGFTYAAVTPGDQIILAFLGGVMIDTGGMRLLTSRSVKP